jgi:hypothetical protein
MDILDCYIVENEYDNGTKITKFQTIRFSVNGKQLPLVDCIDFVLSYLMKKSQFELFTCSCGIAGCAGWFEGVKVKNRKNTVEWRLLDRKEKLQLEDVKRFYSFSRANYKEVCFKCVELLVKMEKNELTLLEYMDDDEYRQKSDLMRSVVWAANRYDKKIYKLIYDEYKKQIG